MKIDSSDLVSVIVPFLNGSHWLIEALESVLKQTHTNWELIVVDDGSEEKHSLAAKEFCYQHGDKILYTEHAGHVNKGVTISRNEAAQFARGKYLAFLDADDVWMPLKLETQLKHFINHPNTQAVCNSIVQWYSWNSETIKDVFQIVGAPHGKCYPRSTLIKLLYPLYNGASPAPSGIMIRKDAFQRIGGFEPAFSGVYELYEDQAFLSKLYLNETVYISEAADVMYRKRSNSMSSAANNIERYYTVRKFYLDWLENYMRQQNIYDEEINALIEKARQQMFVLQLL